VKRDASQDDICRAYRRLAKKLHPDLNPGDKAAEERFKQLTRAYAILGNGQKRVRVDRGEIDATASEQLCGRYYRDFAVETPTFTRAARALPTSPMRRAFSPRYLGALSVKACGLRGQDVHYRLEVCMRLWAELQDAERAACCTGGN
jgi:curved DNA-binding protein CbpA